MQDPLAFANVESLVGVGAKDHRERRSSDGDDAADVVGVSVGDRDVGEPSQVGFEPAR